MRVDIRHTGDVHKHLEVELGKQTEYLLSVPIVENIQQVFN